MLKIKAILLCSECFIFFFKTVNPVRENLEPELYVYYFKKNFKTEKYKKKYFKLTNLSLNMGKNIFSPYKKKDLDIVEGLSQTTFQNRKCLKKKLFDRYFEQSFGKLLFSNNVNVRLEFWIFSGYFFSNSNYIGFDTFNFLYTSY
jgi:hypothetical protein